MFQEVFVDLQQVESEEWRSARTRRARRERKRKQLRRSALNQAVEIENLEDRFLSGVRQKSELRKEAP